jgi:hypothetical protein
MPVAAVASSCSAKPISTSSTGTSRRSIGLARRHHRAAIQTCDAIKAPACRRRVAAVPRRAVATLSRSDLLVDGYIFFDLTLRFVASDAIALLDFADKLIALTSNHRPVIVR